MKSFLIPILIIVGIPFGALAQENNSENLPFCLTSDVKHEKLSYYQNNLANYRFLSDDTLFVPVKLHILGTDEGIGYPNVANVLRAFCILNENFEQANIRFYITGDINYINNTAWYDHESFGAGHQMMQQNNVPWALNSYIVKTAAGACGYYSPGPDGVALAMSCLGPVNHTWAHEIGHQLTLPHTFYGWEGTSFNNSEPAPEEIRFRGAWVQVERADGSNCRHAADGFCDTAADYISSRWSCTAANPFGQTLVDPLGETFKVDGRNIMSYSSGTCRGTFSAEQIQAMRMNLLLDRYHIIDFDAYFKPIPAKVSFLYPDANSEVQYDNTTVSWKSVPNATEYRVQLTNLPFFQNLLVNEVVTDTFLRLPVLEPGTNYNLRVQSLSNFQPCNEYSETLSFLASDLSYVHYQGEAGGEFYFENPIKSGRDIVVFHRNGNNSVENIQLSLMEISGRIVGQNNGFLDSSSGFQLQTKDLSPGTYLLRFHFDGYPPQVRKLIIVQ